MTKDDIKYLVLTSLGYTERPDFVNSKDNAVRIVNEQYEHYFSLCVSSGKWNFFTKKSELQNEEVEGKYKYRFEFPDDIEVLNMAYYDKTYNYPIREYELAGKYIYTNTEKCFIDYTGKVCEENLPPYFVEYMRLNMASNICQLITGDNNLEQSLFVRAERAYSMAKSIDNKQKPARILNTNVFTGGRM